MNALKLPIVLTVSEVARIIGWTKTKTRRWLDKCGALTTRGGRAVTTPELLRSTFPEAWDECLTALEAREADND
jgi:hypothetical protein